MPRATRNILEHLGMKIEEVRSPTWRRGLRTPQSPQMIMPKCFQLPAVGLQTFAHNHLWILANIGANPWKDMYKYTKFSLLHINILDAPSKKQLYKIAHLIWGDFETTIIGMVNQNGVRSFVRGLFPHDTEKRKHQFDKSVFLNYEWALRSKFQLCEETRQCH